MPTSRLPRQNTEAPPAAGAARFVWPFLAIVAVAVASVALVALPASLLGRVLPQPLHADDFSGSVWHGSASLSANARDLGAVEWHVHPLALLTLAVAADVHWVTRGYVLDARIEVDRRGARLRDIHGGGPLEDLAAFGFAPGWRGASTLALARLDLQFAADSAAITALVGEVDATQLTCASIANGAPLGNYTLHFPGSAPPASGASTNDAPTGGAPIDGEDRLTAALDDAGGPLELQADIQYSARARTGMLSGSIKERGTITPALRTELQQLAQLHARDAQGRLPVDLEFTL